MLPAWGTGPGLNEPGHVAWRVGRARERSYSPNMSARTALTWGRLFHVNIARGAKPFSFSAPDDGPSIAFGSANGGFVRIDRATFKGSARHSDVGAAVGDVKRTFEVGAFGGI